MITELIEFSNENGYNKRVSKIQQHTRNVMGKSKNSKRSAKAKGLTIQIDENTRWRPETTSKTGRNYQAK